MLIKRKKREEQEQEKDVEKVSNSGRGERKMLNRGSQCHKVAVSGNIINKRDHDPFNFQSGNSC